MRGELNFLLTCILLFVLSVTYFMKGIFLSKLNLPNKSESISFKSPQPDKKIILLLIDALREDFVEMD